jgi:anti-sigma factor RsiW
MTAHLDYELSAYLDGEIDEAERRRVEAHLADCADCRALLDDLRQMVRRSRALDDRPPSHDLWPGIEARIASASTADVIPLATRRRRVSFSVPQLAAAAVALMALSTGITATALRGARGTTPPGSAPAETAVRAASTNVPGPAGLESYDAAIGELQQALDARRDQLDTTTVRVLEQSLDVIDRAIAQARSALARDPDNTYLNGHLQRSLDRKLELLRQVATLPVES